MLHLFSVSLQGEESQPTKGTELTQLQPIMPGFLTDFHSVFFLLGTLTLSLSLAWLLSPLAADSKALDELKRVLNINAMRPTEESWSLSILISVLTFFSICLGGIIFAFGQFLSLYDAQLESSSPTLTSGARLAVIFYASQVLAQAANCAALKLTQKAFVISSSLASILAGTFAMTCFTHHCAFVVGTVLIGLGTGSLFPSVLFWVERQVPVTGQVLAMLYLASRVGEAIFTIPEVALLERVPSVHVYLFLAGLLAVMTSGVLAHCIIKQMKIRAMKFTLDRQFVSFPSIISVNV